MRPYLSILGPTNQCLQHTSGERNNFQVVRKNRDANWAHIFVQAYEGHLELVLQHVQNLITAIDGKVVTPAVHCNMFGERQRRLPTAKMWVHP